MQRFSATLPSALEGRQGSGALRAARSGGPLTARVLTGAILPAEFWSAPFRSDRVDESESAGVIGESRISASRARSSTTPPCPYHWRWTRARRRRCRQAVLPRGRRETICAEIHHIKPRNSRPWLRQALLPSRSARR